MIDFFPYALWALGLLLIFLEFYLPGAVLGIMGGLLLLASLYQYVSSGASALGILSFVSAMIASVALLIKFTLWKIRTSKSSFSIYSNSDQKGYVASHFDQNVIGKKGVVSSDLKPGGYITIEGKQHQAISQSGYVVKGTEVWVIGGQEESLIVTTRKK